MFHSRSERSAAADTSMGGRAAAALPLLAAAARAAPGRAAPANATAVTLQALPEGVRFGWVGERGDKPSQGVSPPAHPPAPHLLLCPASMVRTLWARVLSITTVFCAPYAYSPSSGAQSATCAAYLWSTSVEGGGVAAAGGRQRQEGGRLKRACHTVQLSGSPVGGGRHDDLLHGGAGVSRASCRQRRRRRRERRQATGGVIAAPSHCGTASQYDGVSPGGVRRGVKVMVGDGGLALLALQPRCPLAQTPLAE